MSPPRATATAVERPFRIRRWSVPELRSGALSCVWTREHSALHGFECGAWGGSSCLWSDPRALICSIGCGTGAPLGARSKYWPRGFGFFGGSDPEDLCFPGAVLLCLLLRLPAEHSRVVREFFENSSNGVLTWRAGSSRHPFIDGGHGVAASGGLRRGLGPGASGGAWMCSLTSEEGRRSVGGGVLAPVLLGPEERDIDLFYAFGEYTASALAGVRWTLSICVVTTVEIEFSST